MSSAAIACSDIKAGGAITAFNSNLTFTENTINPLCNNYWINFINNLGGSGHGTGGAIATYKNTVLSSTGSKIFYEHNTDAIPIFGKTVLSFSGITKSIFSILPNTTVYWEINHCGGAILSPLSHCTPFTPHIPNQECFFQLPSQNLSNATSFWTTLLMMQEV